MDTEMTWINAIVMVLRLQGEPMDYNQIAQAIVDNGFRDVSSSVAPATSVNTTISLYMKNQGERCPVVKISRGIYGLREWGKRDLSVGLPSAMRATSSTGSFVDEVIEMDEEDDFESLPKSLIRCFGMYWRLMD